MTRALDKQRGDGMVTGGITCEWGGGRGLGCGGGMGGHGAWPCNATQARKVGQGATVTTSHSDKVLW